MAQTNTITHRELINLRQPYSALPGGVFGREDIFQTDMDIFFSKHWIVVGVTPQIPKPGDSINVTVGKYTVSLVRQNVLTVAAFRSVGDSDDAHSSKPCAVRVVGAHILVCFDDHPPADIDYLTETLSPRFAPYEFADSKIAFEMEIIEDGNWKLVIENNRECYHCAAGHPELNVAFIPMEDFSDGSATAEQQAERDALQAQCAMTEKSWANEGWISEAVEYLDEDATTQFRTERWVISNHGESLTLSTRVACSQLLGNLTRRDLGDLHFWTHNSWTHVMSDHAVIAYLIPLSTGKTLVRSKWLVHKDAVEGRDYNLKELTEVWIATHQQDAALVGITHSGTQDAAYVPGPFSPVVENFVDQFTRWYSTRLAAHGI
ncbi:MULTISPECIES: SRPBCC family protein [unclassified Pseudomonas]|uniref:SRPBCC family protein n=1 Tax=Pseudomonas sp. CC120222-01a TaxID=1378075 RepID=UPI000D91FEF4|nr:Rieske 2Fe-2S family protein [Pseudomonas sp. CC120222-01a]